MKIYKLVWLVNEDEDVMFERFFASRKACDVAKKNFADELKAFGLNVQGIKLKVEQMDVESEV